MKHKLFSHEYEKLLSQKSIETYRDIGVSLYEKLPTFDPNFEYEMYILKAEDKSNKEDMYPTLCKLKIGIEVLENISTYMENPYGLVGNILPFQYGNHTFNLQCIESRISSIIRSDTLAHGLCDGSEILKQHIKSKSYISSQSLRFIVYCWYNKYELLDN
jgi:hypothetical protein